MWILYRSNDLIIGSKTLIISYIIWTLIMIIIFYFVWVHIILLLNTSHSEEWSHYKDLSVINYVLNSTASWLYSSVMVYDHRYTG